MAERRRTAATRPVRSRTRRPAGRDEQEAFEEDESDADRDGSFANHGGNGNRRAARQDGSFLTARQAARAALRQMVELTSKHAESITGVERREDGWTVSIEVVEDRRIPSSADILATYETEVDGDGELMSYRRVKRYSRGRGDCN